MKTIDTIHPVQHGVITTYHMVEPCALTAGQMFLMDDFGNAVRVRNEGLLALCHHLCDQIGVCH